VCFAIRFFNPPLFPPACSGLCFCSSCIHTTEMLGKEKEKKGNSLPVSFYLLVATVANQKRSATRISSSKCRCVRLVNFLSFAFGFVFIFLGCKLQSVRVYTAGLNCGRWTIWPISVYRCAVGIRDRHKRLVFPNVRNTRPPLLRPSVRECVRKWRSEMLSGDWPPANNTVSTTAITVQRNNNKLRTQYKKKKKKVSLRMGSFCFPI
jgi:hypothetical protein